MNSGVSLESVSGLMAKARTAELATLEEERHLKDVIGLIGVIVKICSIVHSVTHLVTVRTTCREGASPRDAHPQGGLQVPVL